jgi:heavy metal efflux system protein
MRYRALFLLSRLIEYLLDKKNMILVVWLGFMLAASLAVKTLPLEAFPDISNMQVRVITQVPGKAAEEIERLVTIPIEKELNGIPHSRSPRSVSIFGLSVITLVFDDKVDTYTARQQVLERLADATLPPGVNPKLDPNASPVGEIFRYSVEGKGYSVGERKETQEWLISRLFKSVDGIVDSTTFGGPTKVFSVELDPGRMLALGANQTQIAESLYKSNDSTGGSYIIRNDQRYMVRGVGLLKSIDDIKNVVVFSKADGVPIKIKDLAEVRLEEAVRNGQVGLDDRDDIVQGILMMRRGDNPSRVIHNLTTAWPEIISRLPQGMYLEPLYDRTSLVKKTLHTIGDNVLEGVILVIAVLLAFLFQFRAALICAAVIPSALLFAVTILTLTNTPANLLSLGAIDFGIIVDGAVILIEGIIINLSQISKTQTHFDSIYLKEKIVTATSNLAKPIAFSTVIMLITFLPIFGFEHVEGRLFKPLAVMMTLTLIGAAVSTFTIVPVLARLLYAKHLPSHRTSLVGHALQRFFAFSLRRASTGRIANFLLPAAGIILSIPFIFISTIGTEFIPELEEGNIWLTVTAYPTSLTLERAVNTASSLRKILRNYPEVSKVLTQIGAPDDGTDPNPYSVIQTMIALQPQKQWRPQMPTKDALVGDMTNRIGKALPGINCNFSQYIKDNMDEAMSGVKNGQFAIKIYGHDIDTLEALSRKATAILKSVPGMVDVASDNLTGQPQIIVSIDQERASRFGVTTSDILNIVETSIGGRTVTQIVQNERTFNLILRLAKHYRDTPHSLGEILVATPTGHRIPLKQVATIEQKPGAAAIYRDKNRRRQAVYANVRGRDLGSAAFAVKEKIDSSLKQKLPPGYSIEYAGEFERAREAGIRLGQIIPITIVLIFFVLYFLFDSAPFALLSMLPIPIAASVTLCVLKTTGTHLSISSGLGFIVLMGLAIQNSVLVVTHFKESIKRGLTVSIAAQHAAIAKYKPIITAALVAATGLIPAAIASGIGSQSQKPFAIVIASGIVPVTVLTLYAIPLCINAAARFFGFNADVEQTQHVD